MTIGDAEGQITKYKFSALLSTKLAELSRLPGCEEAQTSPPKKATWRGLGAAGRKMPVGAPAASVPCCSCSIHCPRQELPS